MGKRIRENFHVYVIFYVTYVNYLRYVKVEITSKLINTVMQPVAQQRPQFAAKARFHQHIQVLVVSERAIQPATICGNKLAVILADSAQNTLRCLSRKYGM